MTTEHKPLISAIVSTYNSERFIKGKIEDLLAQTIADRLEIIIVNSGSQQNEEKIIKDFLIHPNIHYIKTAERETVYKAWNRGIKASKGLFITNTNTDDRLRKDALEVLSSALINNQDIALVYADQYYSHIPNQTFEEVARQRKPKLYSFPDYNYFHQLDRCLVCSQPMWRASLHFEDNIWFDEKYEICGDYEFNLKITQKYNMLRLPYPLGSFYISLTRQNLSLKDSEKGTNEIRLIAQPYILDYINSIKKEESNNAIEKFEKYIRFPLPLFYLWKRVILFIKPELIKNKFFHSIEFVYYFTIAVLEREHKIKEAIRLSKKFLRYGKSRRIEERLKNLLRKNQVR
jgi:glycosyltransferase involved in cell wall biosynthesis